MSDTPVEEMNFETAMAELEKVLGQLENGNVALDESIALYERGAKLKARCETKLKEAEEKVAEALREARAKANEVIEQAHARANQIIDAAKVEAIAEAGRQKALALSEIDSAANRAKEDLRRQVSALAVAGAEKLIRKEIDGNAHKALLDELAAEI